MNNVFIISAIIISFLNLFYFNLKDVIFFPSAASPEYTFLKNFSNEFKNIKEIGFYSDEENPVYVTYRIQNSIMPVFLKNSVEADYIFCYSQNGICRYFFVSKQAELVRMYSDNLFLLKKPEIKK